jgi:hypothetical protein
MTLWPAGMLVWEKTRPGRLGSERLGVPVEEMAMRIEGHWRS